jgi:thiamine biosynthesis lipoprotein
VIAIAAAPQNSTRAVPGKIGAPPATAPSAPSPARPPSVTTTTTGTEGSIATSGDYRHFVTVKGKRLSHTIDPARGAPLIDAPASVTVLSALCTWADAMATALMVMGAKAGPEYAHSHNLNSLFLLRQGEQFTSIRTGSFAR